MKIIHGIRQFDKSDMQGDPLEGLSKFFDFIFVIFGLGILILVIEGIIWFNK